MEELFFVLIEIGLLCLIYHQNDLKLHSKHFMILKIYRHEIVIAILVWHCYFYS